MDTMTSLMQGVVWRRREDGVSGVKAAWRGSCLAWDAPHFVLPRYPASSHGDMSILYPSSLRFKQSKNQYIGIVF